MVPLPKSDITYTDFLKIDESTNENLEFIDGRIYNMAGPSLLHQLILTRLSTFFDNYFRDKECYHVNSPFDVIFKNDNEKHKTQPDLSVICDKRDLTALNYEGIPTLIIEVLSPSTRSKDLITKMNLYMRFGVKEYWIISPEKKQVTIYNFENGTLKYDPITITENEILKSNIFENFEVDLKEVFPKE